MNLEDSEREANASINICSELCMHNSLTVRSLVLFFFLGFFSSLLVILRVLTVLLGSELYVKNCKAADRCSCL